MTNIRNRIEKGFENLGFVIYRKKYLFLVMILVPFLILASFLPKTTVDTSTEGFLHETDVARVTYNEFRDQFGRDEKIVVAIKTPGIFQFTVLEKLRDLQTELAENVPYLNDITGLINARSTTGNEESLIVEDLFEHWPENEIELEAIRQKALNNPLLTNLVINEAGTFTAIVLESNTYSVDEISEDELFAGFDELAINDTPKAFLSDAENSEMVQAVEKIIAKYQSDDFVIYSAGSPSVTDQLKRSMAKDMAKFIAMIMVTILIFLAILFRRASGIILPILTVLISVMSTMGLMAYFSIPIQTMTQIIPSFLLAVGVGASIHLLAMFYHHYDTHHNKAEAIAHTLGHSGLAITLTSLTTAAGLASFSFSTVAPVARLGIFASIGVLIVLAFTLILLPALLSIFPVKAKKKPKTATGHHDRMEEMLVWFSHFSVKHAGKIVIISVLFAIVALASASQLRYSHDPLKWFPEDHPVRVATEVIDHEMQGSISMELVIDTGKENGLYDLDVLQGLDELGRYAESIKTDLYFVGKAVSLSDIIKEIHQALNENRKEFYAIPHDSELIAQEILLFENSGSDDLEDWVDSRFSKARMTIKVPWIDSIDYHGLLNDVSNKADTLFAGKATVTMTGMIPLLAETISAAIYSSGYSYLIAFIAIALMMMAMLGSVKLGAISMFPNLIPIFSVLAVMVVFNIPLDLFTMLIGAIVIGMAVDDTVHFMHNFKRYYDDSHDVEQAIRQTLTSTGRAMLVTSIVLSVGFFIYIFASMNNLLNFGLLTSIAIVVALLADFLLAPALMVLIYRNKHNREATL